MRHYSVRPGRGTWLAPRSAPHRPQHADSSCAGTPISCDDFVSKIVITRTDHAPGRTMRSACASLVLCILCISACASLVFFVFALIRGEYGSASSNTRSRAERFGDLHSHGHSLASRRAPWNALERGGTSRAGTSP